MSARRPSPLRIGDPLPPVFDHATKLHIGYGIPVEGRRLDISADQEREHAFRGRVSGGRVVSLQGDRPTIPALGTLGVSELETALCAAAHAGHDEVVRRLCAAGVADRVVDTPPLAAAAVGRRASAARILTTRGANPVEAANFLRARGEDEAANWLMRR